MHGVTTSFVVFEAIHYYYYSLLPSVSEVIVSVRLGSPIEQPTHIIAVAANIV